MSAPERKRKRQGTIAILGHRDVRDVVVYIYGLTDPDGTVRYVGKSCDPPARLTSHCSPAAAKPIKAWVSSLRERGHRPGLVVLHVVLPGEDVDRWELHYIWHFRAHGRLLNCQFAAEYRARVEVA